jgi:hypothetical protein
MLSRCGLRGQGTDQCQNTYEGEVRQYGFFGFFDFSTFGHWRSSVLVETKDSKRNITVMLLLVACNFSYGGTLIHGSNNFQLKKLRWEVYTTSKLETYDVSDRIIRIEKEVNCDLVMILILLCSYNAFAGVSGRSTNTTPLPFHSTESNTPDINTAKPRSQSF